MPLATIIYYVSAGAYYIAIIFAVLFSVFSVYILLRYGRNILMSLVVSVIYAIVFLSLMQQSLVTLHSIAP